MGGWGVGGAEGVFEVAGETKANTSGFPLSDVPAVFGRTKGLNCSWLQGAGLDWSYFEVDG